MQHLCAIRHAKNAAARDASDRCFDIRSRLQRAEIRKRHLQEQYHPRVSGDALKAIEREIESIRAEHADADQRRSEASAAFAAAGAVHDAARKYAAAEGLAMPIEDADAMTERRGPIPEEGEK